MKKTITNILATTGITLVALAVIATCYGGKYLFISSVFECLGANTVIYLGFMVTRKFESQYAILEATVDIVFTIIVLITFGAVFDWFSSTPMWIIVIMAVVIYTIGISLSFYRMHEDISKINKLLKMRKTIIFNEEK